MKNAEATKSLSQPILCTPKETLAKFYRSTSLGLRFMISSVAPTRLSTFKPTFNYQNRKP